MDRPSLESRSQNLQMMFEDLLGRSSVYYNPPADLRMSYDAIVYSRSRIENTFASDAVYGQADMYEVTTITTDPDSEIISKISKLPMCRHDRYFVSDNLHHNVFTLYF